MFRFSQTIANALELMYARHDQRLELSLPSTRFSDSPRAQWPTGPKSPLKIAWLTTGRGPGSFAALEHVLNEIRNGLPISISVVFLNRDRGEAEATDRLIALAECNGLKVETLSSVSFRKAHHGQRSSPGEPLPGWRVAYDTRVANILGQYDFSIGVLFGYMLILTESLWSRFQFINDHPALPTGPVGTYTEVIDELIDNNARRSGCMINSVTGDVDRGPALAFCEFGIRDGENEGLWRAYKEEPSAESRNALFQDIRRRGLIRERPFLVEALRLLGNGALFDSGSSPMDLTDHVERAVVVAIARHFHRTCMEILGRDKSTELEAARAVAAATLRSRGMSLDGVGRALGGRTPWTIRHSASKGRELVHADSSLRQLFSYWTGQEETRAPVESAASPV